MAIRGKQVGSGEFTLAQVGRIFATGSITGTELAAGTVDTGQIAAGAITATEIASAAIGNGIAGGAGTALNIDVDSETGGNIQGVNVTANGVGVDMNAVAGTGVEADGSANLRLASQGAGIAGGAGTTLSLEVNTGTFSPTFTGAGSWSFSADRLQVTGIPDTANDAVNKSYADSLATGLQWLSPVSAREVIGSSTVATINGLAAGATIGDCYVATDAGTPTQGISDALVAGSVTEWNGTDWKVIIAGSGGFVPAGLRGLASIQTALNGTIGLVNATDDGKILEWDGTSLTPGKVTPAAGDAVLVTDQDNDGDSVFANLGYTFQGAVPTGVWTQFTGAGQINAGAGLTKTANTLDVGAGTGISVAADAISFDATAVDGNGLIGSGSTLTVDPDTETGGNVQGVNITANGVGVDVSAIAGTNLEADGSANLRIAASAAGAGLAGGGASVLSVGAGNSITVNANDVAVNPAGLIKAGAAEIDADLLAVSQVPTNYTRSTAGDATVVDQLAAHLTGIDNALASAGGTARQEDITTQVITATDTAITDTLNFTPISGVSVRLFLNGIMQQQGGGNDYTVSGSTITWLASTGTAVDMDTSDVLVAVYSS